MADAGPAVETGAIQDALSPREVFVKCVKAVQIAEGSLEPVDSFIDTFISKVPDEGDAAFIRQVFLGCERMRKLLKVVVDGYFASDGMNMPRSDHSLYLVLCYLSFVGITDIGAEGFEAMLIALPRNMMQKSSKFLSFAWNPESLTTWIANEWKLVYDPVYVEVKVLEVAQENYDALMATIDTMSAKLATVGQSVPKLKTTTVKPFNLTQPKPKTIRIPKPIAAVQKHNPVPKSTYRSPIEMEALERKKRVNKMKATETKSIADKSGAARRGIVAKAESDKTRRLREELRERELAETKIRIAAKPIPASNKKGSTVKLNAGAILREEKHFREQSEKESRRLKEVEAGGFDSTHYLKWEEEQRLLEAAKELEDIEIKHLQGLISREDAIIARQAQAEKKTEGVQELKAQRQELLKRYVAEQVERGELNRRLVEQTAQLADRVAKAREQELKAKTAIKKKVDEESKALLEAAAEREAEERERRAEIIRQIRALEMVPVDRTKVLDLTETAGIGVLSEMSFIELRERLAMLKVRNAKEEATRREDIKKKKAEAEAALSDKIESIAAARAARMNAAAAKVSASIKVSPRKETDRVLQLREKLAQKKLAAKPVRSSLRT